MQLRAPTAASPVTRASMTPSTAVVIAAYNASTTVAASVQSALQQTAPPTEIIVCDDGSEDYDELVVALEPFGDRVRLIAVSHGGESRAKNAGVAAATAELVCILDADDVWEPRRLEALVEAARERPDISVFTTDAWHVRDGRRILRHYEANAFPVVAQREAILRTNFIFGHTAVRRRAWDEVGGFSESLVVGADWDCWLRLLYAGHLVALVDEPLADYVLSSDSLSANRARALRARVLLLEKARREQQMTKAEAGALRSSVRYWRSAAAVAEAKEALQTGAPDARRLCAVAALTRGVSLRGRSKLLTSAAAPGRARRSVP